MVERFLIETTSGYDEISQSQIQDLKSQGYHQAVFVIEYNNNKGHYYETAHLWTKDHQIGETFDEFCHRIAQEFLSWVCLVLG